jgi:hypothetical protein
MRTKIWTFSLAGTLVFCLLVPTLQAQLRDAGSKLRGEFGRTRTMPTRATQSFTSALPPMVESTPSYEAFSVEPLAFGIGDSVTVVGAEARLMRGQRTMGMLPAGQKIRVQQIRGPWVGTVADIDGRTIGGWVWYSQVAPTASP